MRPVTEYACQVFDNSLTKYLSDDLENLQKRALGIIFPHTPYCEALEQAGLAPLYSRIDILTTKLFNDIVKNTSQTPFTLGQMIPDSLLIRNVLTSDSFCRLH